MRGLTADESYELKRQSVGSCICDASGMTPQQIARTTPEWISLVQRLVKRGLMVWRQCDAGHNLQHPWTTPLGRLALQCDQLARSTFVP